MEKISVIMPAYGVEKYIAKSIESVLNQTYKNLELIIVDDESPDNSGKIADEYAAKDDRVKVIHKKNGGVASARNAALDIASGDYITFIDSDDFADIHQYEVLYNLIKKYDVDISFCEVQRFFEDEDPIKDNVEIKESLIETSEALKQMLTNDCVGNYIHIKMFKSELWKDIRFPENCTYEDVATLYKVVGQASKVAYTTEKLYFYLVGRQGAITASFSERKL
jgi:glycosyltransferase involved in cell wall biosynthesis